MKYALFDEQKWDENGISGRRFLPAELLKRLDTKTTLQGLNNAATYQITSVIINCAIPWPLEVFRCYPEPTEVHILLDVNALDRRLAPLALGIVNKVTMWSDVSSRMLPSKIRINLLQKTWCSHDEHWDVCDVQLCSNRAVLWPGCADLYHILFRHQSSFLWF